MLNFEKIDVESYSGYEAYESPRAFVLRGTRYVVRDTSSSRWSLCVKFPYSVN